MTWDRKEKRREKKENTFKKKKDEIQFFFICHLWHLFYWLVLYTFQVIIRLSEQLTEGAVLGGCCSWFNQYNIRKQARSPQHPSAADVVSAFP